MFISVPKIAAFEKSPIKLDPRLTNDKTAPTRLIYFLIILIKTVFLNIVSDE